MRDEGDIEGDLDIGIDIVSAIEVNIEACGDSNSFVRLQLTVRL